MYLGTREKKIVSAVSKLNAKNKIMVFGEKKRENPGKERRGWSSRRKNTI